MIGTLISKRFAELEAKIQDVLSTRKERGRGEWSDSYDDATMHQWMTSVLNLLQRVFGESSIHYRNFEKESGNYPSDIFRFGSCTGIFRAAKDDYENGYLFNVHSLVKAEILAGDVLEQAQELLNAGYHNPACVLIGVALESTLKELCNRHTITPAKLEKMNADLCKANAYNMAKQKQITAWADLRNKAAHGQWEEYSYTDVRLMLAGVQQFLADYL